MPICFFNRFSIQETAKVLKFAILMRVMNKYIFIFIFIIFSTSVSFGQRWKTYRHEFSFGAGTSNYFGDIGGAPDPKKLLGIRDFRLKETRYNVHLGWNYRYTRDISVRYNINYISLTASDAGSKNANRGLSFNTQMFEISGQAQYYLLSEYRHKHAAAVFNRRGAVASNYRLGFYGFAGIGTTIFFPKLAGPSEYLNVDNSQRNTKNYSKVNVFVPFGVGGQFAITKKWLVGFEVGPRISLSDYLDGMSTKWSHAPDVYWLTTFRGIYKIKTDRYGYPVFLKRRSF
jgi:hypothetical protein